MRTKKVVVPAYGDGIIGDAKIDMSIQCLACNNLNDNMITCKAFPNGIHVKILTGHWDHTKHFKGDNGILFERIED